MRLVTTPEDLLPFLPWETGTHGEYSWMSTTDFGINDLLAVCPAVLLNKFVAVTSCDSGPFPLDHQNAESGWEMVDGIAYSPKMASPDLFPYHVHFDVWYVFSEGRDFERIRRTKPARGSLDFFVNYFFRIDDPEKQELNAEMWKMLEHVRPESYIAEADCGWLTFITQDHEALAAVIAALEKRSSPKL